MQQQRQQPIESNNESEATTPTRTGDNLITSSVTPREAKTMGAAPFIFIGIAILIALVVAIVLFTLK